VMVRERAACYWLSEDSHSLAMRRTVDCGEGHVRPSGPINAQQPGFHEVLNAPKENRMLALFWQSIVRKHGR